MKTDCKAKRWRGREVGVRVLIESMFSKRRMFKICFKENLATSPPGVPPCVYQAEAGDSGGDT
jgi:hypothetical protein